MPPSPPRRCFVALALVAGCQPAGCENRKPATIDAGGRGAPRGPLELTEIAALEDARDLGGEGLHGRLATMARSAPDPAVRRRALLALARIGEPPTAALARDALTDDDAAARAMAAFALESIGDEPGADAPASELRLCERLAAEKDREVRRRIVRALGRLGGERGESVVRGLLAGDGRDSDASVRADGLRALLVHGVRGRALAEPTRVALQRALTDGDASIRLAAAQAFYRIKVLPGDAPVLALAVRDADPTIRAAAARALGTAASVPVSVLVPALSDPDFRVRVEAARAVAKEDPAALAPLVDAGAVLDDKAPDRELRIVVALAAMEALAPTAATRPPPPDHSIERKLDAAALHAAGALGRPLAMYRCAAEALRVRAGSDEEQVLDCAPDDLVAPFRRKMMLAAALGDRKDPERLPALLELASDKDDGRVRAAAIDALAAGPELQAGEKVIEALGDKDPGALAAACEAAGKLAQEHHAVLEESAPGAIDRIAIQVRRLDSRGQVEALGACIDALRAFGDPRVLPDLRPRLSDENAAIRRHARDAVAWLDGRRDGAVATPVPPAPARSGPRLVAPPPPPGDPATLAGRRVLATITTDRGAIALELFPDETPRTVAALVELARRGFYDGLSFHRVVTDFVVQGGDPRGDGYGGPWFTLRDEVTPRRFERGVAGVALAGKDTGGSQIFICQGDSPHLDGKYAAFGRVLSGMEVVDRMVIGDPIKRIAITIDGAPYGPR